jgi:hypothetical protein
MAGTSPAMMTEAQSAAAAFRVTAVSLSPPTNKSLQIVYQKRNSCYNLLTRGIGLRSRSKPRGERNRAGNWIGGVLRTTFDASADGKDFFVTPKHPLFFRDREGFKPATARTKVNRKANERESAAALRALQA